MGETQNQPFPLTFHPALRIEFQGSRVTSSGARSEEPGVESSNRRCADPHGR